MTNPNDPANSFFSHDNGNVIGLTKREAFAMAAMQGLLSCEMDGLQITIPQYAAAAVGHADALIAALNVNTKEA